MIPGGYVPVAHVWYGPKRSKKAVVCSTIQNGSSVLRQESHFLSVDP